MVNRGFVAGATFAVLFGMLLVRPPTSAAPLARCQDCTVANSNGGVPPSQHHGRATFEFDSTPESVIDVQTLAEWVPATDIEIHVFENQTLEAHVPLGSSETNSSAPPIGTTKTLIQSAS